MIRSIFFCETFFDRQSYKDVALYKAISAQYNLYTA